ncbi:SAM-dependent methyltransferase [Falsirhodobacter sp. alg1]|uniref:SAM-dependent methyltransferase n=1 Tax=Falsirhodobacter sp. alg1 TaxID=1472418 RepID=UPI0005EF5E51|nr:SAM-dependent methyltransferase [Falsirhodobacter sp. alg1]
MPRKETLRHLSGLYAATDDPWNHRTSPYEAAKYAATLDAIGPGPFDNALEIGCGNGTLLARLAPRCRRLTGIDCVRAAALAARAAVAGLPHVQVLEGSVPEDLPDLVPDLVLLSEVMYFLTHADIHALCGWLRGTRARVVCVNWLGPTDEELDGQSALDTFRQALGQSGTGQAFGKFRIDMFRLDGTMP